MICVVLITSVEQEISSFFQATRRYVYGAVQCLSVTRMHCVETRELIKQLSLAISLGHQIRTITYIFPPVPSLGALNRREVLMSRLAWHTRLPTRLTACLHYITAGHPLRLFLAHAHGSHRTSRTISVTAELLVLVCLSVC